MNVHGGHEAEPLFRSAHQALKFAYNFSASQHGTAGAAERQIAVNARERYENLPSMSRGRGLRGNDGAAQAAMIRLRVERSCSPFEQVILAARFNEIDHSERRAACLAIALRLEKSGAVRGCVRTIGGGVSQTIGGGISQTYGGVFPLVRRYFGAKVNVGRIADQHGVTQRTVYYWILDAKKWLYPQETLAMHKVEDTLEQARIVVTSSDARTLV